MIKFTYITSIVLTCTLFTACGGSSNNNNSNDGLSADTDIPTNDIVIPTISSSNERIASRNYTFINGETAQEIFTYDSQGRIDTITYDVPAFTSGNALPSSFDSSPKSKTQFSYDANNFITTIQQDIFTDLANPNTVTFSEVSTFTWDNATFMVTGATVERLNGDGALISSLIATVDNNGQMVNGWTESIINTTPTSSTRIDSTIALVYGDNNLPQIAIRTNAIEITKISYTWNNPGFTLNITDGISAPIIAETIFTFTETNRTESRTLLEEGNVIRNQTQFIYDANDRLERIDYADTGSVDIINTSIDVIWEPGLCQTTMIWEASGVNINFIARGNEPYLPATGYRKISYCNL